MKSLMLATLCLNEMEHLPKLYDQHKDWPGLKNWTFVEAADKVYAETNPALVNSLGLSIDGTGEFLQQLAAKDSRVTYVPFGFSSHVDPAQGKIAARQQYLTLSNKVQPDFLIVLDADEFFCLDDQTELLKRMDGSDLSYTGFQVLYRDIWRPASIIDQPLFQYEVVGGYWDVRHCHCWRWKPNLQYTTHTSLSGTDGKPLTKKMALLYVDPIAPQCIHLGFACNAKMRKAKNDYYIARGEGRNDRRQMYVDCRRSFEAWKLGDELPHRARVISYTGKVPEVFQCQQTINCP